MSGTLYDVYISSKHHYSRKKTEEFVVEQLQKQVNQTHQQIILSLQQLHQASTFIKESYPLIPNKVPLAAFEKKDQESISSSLAKV